MRYRLINENEVVGFRWETETEVVYSEDGNAWRSKGIENECEEPFTGFKDQSGQALYWGDIVLIRDPATKATSHLPSWGAKDRRSVWRICKLGLSSCFPRKTPLLGDWALG